MEIEDLKDSVKVWFDDKLKNPYFASVLAVWLITNRVAVFGLFNFNEKQSLQERISWVHHQLQYNKVYPLKIFGVEEIKGNEFFVQGFYPVIGYSFLLGLITMVAFRYLNVIGKGAYAVLGRGANTLNQKIKPDKWRPIEEVVELQEKTTELELTIEKNQKEYKILKQENEAGVLALAKMSGEKADLERESSQNNSKIIEETKSLKDSNQNLKEINDKLHEELEKYASASVSITGSVLKEGDFEKIKRKDEIEKFLKSENASHFDDIMEAIMHHQPISLYGFEHVRDYYITNELIALKDNLFVITPKGEEFYREFLKTKNQSNEKLNSFPADERLQLLEKDLSAIDPENEVKGTFNADVFFKMYSSWISDLLRSVIPVIQQYNKFFTGTQHYISIGYASTTFINEAPETIIEKFSVTCNEQNRQRQLLTNQDDRFRLSAAYGTLIKGGLKTFGCNYGFEIKFDSIGYKIYVDEFTETGARSQKEFIEPRLLHQPFTRKEIENLAKFIDDAVYKHIDFNTKQKGIRQDLTPALPQNVNPKARK